VAQETLQGRHQKQRSWTSRMRCQCLLLSTMIALCMPAHAADDEAMLNPIRKVVNLLQNMQKKVMAEGEKEKELYEKFMCYCRTSGGDISGSIAAAESKVPAVSSSIEESEQKLTQSKADLKTAQADRTAAKEAIAEATALRKKEASAFAADKAEYDANIAAISKAVAALERGMAGGFLQTSAAQVLRDLASKQDMMEADRQELVAFLSGSTGYAPASGEITGILKELGSNMAKSLADITAEEQSSIQTYEELVKAKLKEVEALTSSVESKTEQIGELGVQIVQMKNDLSDTQAALEQDRKFQADLQKGCSTKTSEWEERSKTRADELVALGETIKVLNDDDALELFKKTLPSAGSASLVQVLSSVARVRAEAADVLRREHSKANSQDRPGLDFLMVALTGKKALAKGGFDQVVKMIDNMVEILKKEQNDDDHKKEYCGLQLDQADDKKKVVERSLQQSENGIATATEAIATLKEEIKALEVGLKELDASVAGATEQRKAENSEYKELMAADGNAKEVLRFAKNRLNKFYNPALHRAAPKRELSEQDRIVENLKGEGAMLVQISAHQQGKDAPLPPPDTWGAYSTKSGESSGVIAMIDLLIKDLDKEMTEADTEEKNAQITYETMMQESAAKRTMDSKSLTGKASALANTEGELQALHDDKKDAAGELMATTRYIASLHSECDWLLQYHDVRKEARAGEIDSLVKAKAVLNGADFSMLQTRAHGFLGRSF